MNTVSVIALLIILGSIILSPTILLASVFICSSFSAMTVLPGNVVPAMLASIIFLFRIGISQNFVPSFLAALFQPRQLGFLGIFWLISLIGAMFLPRLFNGQIFTFSLNTAELEPVRPQGTNYTQTAYLTMSVFMAASVCILLQKKHEFLDALLKAIFAGGYAIIATGLIDIIANLLGKADMLKIFYTANYGYSAGSILGTRRVLGLTPEPAAFGGLAMTMASLLLFLRPVYAEKMRRFWVPLLGWSCMAMGFLSTSSTAYASLFLMLGLYLFYNVDAVSEEGKILHKSITKKMLNIVFLAVCFLLAVLLSGNFVDLINTLLIEKTGTSSYIERSSWTAAGLNAFIESYGLGVGIGSVRTSNFFANILASTGLPGALFFSLFLISLYLRHAPKRNSREEAVIKAIKFALLPMFAAKFLAGTTPDFGVLQGILFGTIIALSQSNDSLDLMKLQYQRMVIKRKRNL
ncbi:MAG TPA: hypothetical protein PK513_03645 [Alphaproteobacteria bacterium]|nr:hypothetical protein [Alphaproteobacteria bacterium]USO05557.1 MAG: hypothetical protein H6859_10615 [Rhodospirillales bacterium]HOO81577.1 hypothetical protein [Alphaproteobacteria bacterium]